MEAKFPSEISVDVCKGMNLQYKGIKFYRIEKCPTAGVR
jgi:hypothetical protein